jgi:F-type H+-transporting ATPase subunit b
MLALSSGSGPRSPKRSSGSGPRSPKRSSGSGPRSSKRLPRRFAAALCVAALVAPLAALAAPPAASHGDAHAPAAHGQEPHAGASASHGAPEHAGSGGHGGGHGDPHINWYHGLLGEKEGVEPSLLWRPPGTPPPYVSALLNTLALGFVLVKLAQGPIVNGLRTRRERLLKGIEESARMKAEAEKSLAEYKHRLDNLDAEIARVREDMRQASEAERRRILSEAEARRTRLETEARLLIDQELAALHEQLRRETAAAALRSARELLRTQTTGEDQRRLCEGFLQDLRLRSPAGTRPSNGGGHS